MPSERVTLTDDRAREIVLDVVHAWIREDLSPGAQMMIGYYGPQLINRLDAALTGKPSREGGGAPWRLSPSARSATAPTRSW
jgi:hypothetical protein